MLKPALTGPIDKKHLARKSAEKREQRRAMKDPAYLAWVAQVGCIATGVRDVEIHHLREGRLTVGYEIEGVRTHGRDDRLVLPVCKAIHDEGHNRRRSVEEVLSVDYGIDAYATAVGLREGFKRGLSPEQARARHRRAA